MSYVCNLCVVGGNIMLSKFVDDGYDMNSQELGIHPMNLHLLLPLPSNEGRVSYWGCHFIYDIDCGYLDLKDSALRGILNVNFKSNSGVPDKAFEKISAKYPGLTFFMFCTDVDTRELREFTFDKGYTSEWELKRVRVK